MGSGKRFLGLVGLGLTDWSGWGVGMDDGFGAGGGGRKAKKMLVKWRIFITFASPNREFLYRSFGSFGRI